MKLTAVAAVFALSLTAPLARADEPPADGLKYASNTFKVTGLAKFPEHVVVAFPWSLSNGAPTREHVVMKEGEAVHIGRRSPAITLWAVKKTAWDAFAKAELGQDEDANAAALTEFLKAPNAVACDARPERVGTISKDDPREVIEHELVVKSIGDAACDLELAAPAAAAAPVSKGSGSGCAGGDVGGIAWLGALIVLARGRRRVA
ncbi:MAG: hypothetical protein IT385_14620 [Deltaproteobacteria bacterium]|nr:hypothetical protein [Deltaproteobacteria bacterium]